MNSHSQLLTCLLFFSIGILSEAQTKVSIPPARVEFNSLKDFKKENRKELKVGKEIEKSKKKKLKSIGKQARSVGRLPKDSIKFYKNFLSTLQIDELDNVLVDLNKISGNLDSAQLRNTAKKELRAKVEQTDINPELIDSLYQTFSNLDILTANDFDSITTLNDSLLLNDKYRYLLDSQNVDSILINRIPRDSSNINSVTNAIDSVSIDSMSVEENPISNYLQKIVEEKINANYDLPVPEFDSYSSSVKQYIPELEKFNFEKPTIPDEQLLDALVKKQIDEKKQKLKGLLSSEEAPEEKRSLKERVIIGGYLQYIPDPQGIEITPSIALKVRERWRFGLGYTASISLTSDKTKRSALRGFVEYDLLRGYYVHLESEWMEEKSSEKPTIDQRSTYLGLGKSVQFKSVQSNIQFLYNFDAPNAIQNQRVVVRFGINFTK